MTLMSITLGFALGSRELRARGFKNAHGLLEFCSSECGLVVVMFGQLGSWRLLWNKKWIRCMWLLYNLHWSHTKSIEQYSQSTCFRQATSAKYIVNWRIKNRLLENFVKFHGMTHLQIFNNKRFCTHHRNVDYRSQCPFLILTLITIPP